MSDYTTTSELNEIIHYEKLDADIEQAQFEAEGRAYGARMRRAKQLRDAGHLEQAASTCPHGGGYPLASLAAEHESDPRKGEAGVRCYDCRSVLSAWPYEGGEVIHPCEPDWSRT